jgi:hypothetical protein
VRGILIDPKTKIVASVRTAGTFDALYKLIGCTSVEPIFLSKSVVLYADEDGLLGEHPGPFFTIRGHEQPIAGRGIIFGARGHDHCSTNLPLALVAGNVAFPDIEFAGFEYFNTTQERHGMEMPVFGMRAVFRPKGPLN